MSAVLDALVIRFTAIADDLNALDAVAGDGDHGSTMLRGLKAAATDPDTAAKAFRTATGGASGSLFAQVVAALIAAENGENLSDALTKAAERIGQIGQAQPGDRTMLDALIPAGRAPGTDPEAAAMAAAAGADATSTMPARKGRAKHVEGAGLGHVDAGARSVAEILAVFAKVHGASR